MIPTLAVIATHNKREKLYRLCSLLCRLDRVIVIDNASDPPVDGDRLADNVMLFTDDEQPPNLARIWNVGLDIAETFALSHNFEKWNVAILNDDVLTNGSWCISMGAQLRLTKAAIASPEQYSDTLSAFKIADENTPLTFEERLAGYAHVSRGELGLRFDEQFKWYYGDTDYDWQARRNGGTLFVPGMRVTNTDADQAFYARPELQRQAEYDKAHFVAKWGQHAW